MSSPSEPPKVMTVVTNFLSSSSKYFLHIKRFVSCLKASLSSSVLTNGLIQTTTLAQNRSEVFLQKSAEYFLLQIV